MRYLQTIVFTVLLIGSCCISAYAQTRLSEADGTKSGTIDSGLSQRDLNVLSGTDMLKKVDYPSNKAELEAKASSGEPLANLLLGLAYQNGIGFEKNESKGAQLVEIAANAGQPRAMFSLGFFRENGIGLPKSPQIAAQWYKKSSDAGNARGMYALGQMLSEGVVLPKNDAEAAQLFRKSAEAGFDPAMVAWAYALSDGVGVDIDQQSALKWYRAAADLGNSGGMLNVGVMYHAGRGVRQDFVQAHSWYKKSAIASNMDGMFALAKSYAFGEGVTKDSGESDRWLQAAVKAGHKEAREMVTADLAAQPKVAVATQPPSSGSGILAVEVPNTNEVETYISKNQCVVEIRVNTPEEWLDDARMKRLVVANGIRLISQRTCRDKLGREPENINVVVRQKLYVPGFRFGTPCPDEIISVRPWMCDSSLAGNYLGRDEFSGGQGVNAQVERKVVSDAQFKSWGDNSYWMMFGNRPYEKIADDLYLVSYTNKALGKKLYYDQKISREKSEQSARTARKQKEDAAEATRLSQMAAFRRSSIASLPASQKGYGTLAVNKAAEDCFRARMGPGECKGFLISVAKPLALSRADQANGLTAIIQVKITALRRGLPNGAWSGTCQTTTFIQSASGGWLESPNFVIRDYALNCNF